MRLNRLRIWSHVTLTSIITLVGCVGTATRINQDDPSTAVSDENIDDAGIYSQIPDGLIVDLTPGHDFDIGTGFFVKLGNTYYTNEPNYVIEIRKGNVRESDEVHAMYNIIQSDGGMQMVLAVKNNNPEVLRMERLSTIELGLTETVDESGYIIHLEQGFICLYSQHGYVRIFDINGDSPMLEMAINIHENLITKE